MFLKSSLLVLVLLPFIALGQILPKEGCSLNYRIIGFTAPGVDGTATFEVVVAKGKIFNQDSFRRASSKSFSSHTNRIIAEVPEFGADYTWKMIFWNSFHVMISETPLLHFSTQTCPRVGTETNRLRVLQPAPAALKDYLVTVNYGGILYDLDGNPVWYIPEANGIGGNVADLKFYPDLGTVSFLYGFPVETDLNGTVKWEAAKKEIYNGDSMRIMYHHELTRLSNGHFMTLSMEHLMGKKVVADGKPKTYVTDDMTARDGFKRAKFGSINEYDQNGKLVWTWRCSQHLPGSDYDYFTPIDSNIFLDPHENGFVFDEQHKVIYLSFRNLDRVMKIAYPSGKVLAIYGDDFKPGVHHKGHSIFCTPHCVRQYKDGSLYLFNNDACRYTDSLPAIMELKEPSKPGDDLKVTWKFDCPVEPGSPMRYESGGSVSELPDRSFFVCMASEYSKFFIVNRKKEVLWSALPEVYYPSDRKWNVHKQDRSTIISRSDFEKMVWVAEKNK